MDGKGTLVIHAGLLLAALRHRQGLNPAGAGACWGLVALAGHTTADEGCSLLLHARPLVIPAYEIRRVLHTKVACVE